MAVYIKTSPIIAQPAWCELINHSDGLNLQPAAPYYLSVCLHGSLSLSARTPPPGSLRYLEVESNYNYRCT